MSKILDFNGLRRYDEQIKNWVESGLPIKNADLGSQEFNPKAGIYYHGIGINKDIYKCKKEAVTVYVSLNVGQTFANGDAIHFDVTQAAELVNFISNLEYPESGAQNVSLLHGTNYLELLAMKLEPEEGSGNFVYAIAVGDAEKLVFATEDVDFDGIHAVAGFNNLDENGNYIFTGLHDGDDYTVTAEIQSLYEDEALLSTFITTAEVDHVIPPVMEKVILDEDLDAKADLVNGKVPVEEIPDLPVYRNFPASWPTTGTTKAFADAVNADLDAVIGTSYLGDVRFSDLPFGSGSANGELIVDVIGGSVSEKVIHLTLTSGNAKPYRWEYTYWVQAGTAHNSGWIDFQDVFYGADMTALNALKLRQKKANALYVAGDTNELYRWNASLAEFVQVGGGNLNFATDEDIDEIFEEEENEENGEV